MGATERLFCNLAGNPLRPQINKHEMSIRATGYDVEPVGFQPVSQRLSIRNYISGVKLECRSQRLSERHRLGSDHVHQWAALQTWEDRSINLARNLFVIGENESGARAAQC